jgi:hypothetical protein
MSQDPRTIAQMRRKIERLEAMVAELKAALDRSQEAYRNGLYEVVDLRMRHEQAVRIMQGEES